MKYDVVFRGREIPQIEPHFCREYDCFGTNEDHGFSWQEAKEEVARWLEVEREYILEMEENHE